MPQRSSPQKYGGLVSKPTPPRPKVIMTRTLVMPDGTDLLCRQRTDGSWTAEVPLDIAMDIYSDV